jgi:hypothetical protein
MLDDVVVGSFPLLAAFVDQAESVTIACHLLLGPATAQHTKLLAPVLAQST